MKILNLVLLLMVTIATLQIPYSFACSCSSSPDILMTWIGSSGAFQGTVKDVLTGEGPRKVIFDIHQVQKGNYPYGNYTLEDSSIMHYDNQVTKASSCSVDYKIGETYQVFVYDGNRMEIGSTDICSTKQISGFDEYSHEDENGQIQHYRHDYNLFSQYGIFSLIISASILGVSIGVVVWRKRR